MGKLRIISDGTYHGTQLIDANTGEMILGVKSIQWRTVENGKCEAIIRLIDIEAAVEVEDDA